MATQKSDKSTTPLGKKVKTKTTSVLREYINKRKQRIWQKRNRN